MGRILTIIFVLLLTFCDTFSQTEYPAIQKKLNELRSKDSLARWIDYRIDFALENPSKNLPFLMASSNLAWRKPNTYQEKESWLLLLVNQGYYQLQNGDILASINCYEDAYQFSQKHTSALDLEEYILKPLSNNYTRLGDYERAIYIQKRSLSLALRQENLPLATSAYCNLSTSFRSKADLKNAEKFALAGLSIADKSQPIFGLLLSNMADIKNEQKDYKKAELFALQAIKHLNKLGSNNLRNYWLAGAYSLSGDIQLAQGNFNEAKFHYHNAKPLFLKHNRKRELVYVINRLGNVSLRQENYRRALDYFNQAIRYLLPNFRFAHATDLPSEELLYGENKLQEALSGKAEVLQLLGNFRESLQASILAFQVSEKLRKEFTYNLSKQQLQAESKMLAEAIIEKSYKLWRRTKDQQYLNHILIFSEQTKSRILLDELNPTDQRSKKSNLSPLNNQQIKLQQLLSFYQKQKHINPSSLVSSKIADLEFKLSSLQKRFSIKNLSLTTDISTLLKRIPEQKKSLVFFCGDKNTYVIIANNQRIIQVEMLGSTKTLEKMVKTYLNQYFYDGPAAMINRPESFYKLSNEIFVKLFSEIEVKNKNLLVVKDGILNFLPFESLISKPDFVIDIAKWAFLIKTTKVSYAFSLSAMPVVKRKETMQSAKFVGLFLSKTGSNSAEIPAVRQEYSELKMKINGDFLINDYATNANFESALVEAEVLHVSSHSYLTDSLREPVIELYKNSFYLSELASVAKVPSLVILSACQTSDGVYLSGEGVLSFSRGFFAAGSRGVISSLWNINDESSANLMVDFYKNLLLNNSTKNVLANTKLQWLQKDHKQSILLLPYYWDSLIYTGEEFSITLDEPKHYIIYILVSFLTVLIILVLLLRRKIVH